MKIVYERKCRFELDAQTVKLLIVIATLAVEVIRLLS